MHKVESNPAWDPKVLADPHGQTDKAERVRHMFNDIAPTYERVNRVFSGGRDASWRKRAVKLAEVGPADLVLDIACGTGDLARAMSDAHPQQVLGCDFAHAMLVAALKKPNKNISYCEGDALHLPLPDASVSVTSCAFGVRNFQDLDAGLKEMHRVLNSSGRAVILEFTRPKNRLIRVVYEWYCGQIMPRLAGWLSQDRSGAYRYLPRSVVSFPGAKEMRSRLKSVGFVEVRAWPLTFGAVTVYVARKGSNA